MGRRTSEERSVWSEEHVGLDSRKHYRQGSRTLLEGEFTFTFDGREGL